MKKITIARDNHATFYVAVGMAMCQENFISAIDDAQHYESCKSLFPFKSGDYGGYLEIDLNEIKSACYMAGSLLGIIDEIKLNDAFHECIHGINSGLLFEVATRVPNSIRGELNELVEICAGIYKFAFKITKYERDNEHSFEIVEDLSSIPEDEKIERFIELKISF